MRILVCGGRDYTDWFRFNRKMIGIIYPYGLEDTVIISGGAKGADTFAATWGERFGLKVEEYPANWEEYGKAAGAIRNQQMLDEGKPDLVVAFSGGKGTADMIRRAEKAGVEVVKIDYD